MKASTRFITSTALFTAILIAVQFALSGVAGVELVTVIFLAFCYCAGQRAGLTVGICFSLLRCFLFGFYIRARRGIAVQKPASLACDGNLRDGFAVKSGILRISAHVRRTLYLVEKLHVLARCRIERRIAYARIACIVVAADVSKRPHPYVLTEVEADRPVRTPCLREIGEG